MIADGPDLSPLRDLAYALAEETGAELRASVADGTGDWRQLWALLCGLALTVPPGDTETETAKLARAVP